MRLKNKVCIVTGSSKGIGASIAEEFVKEGAKIIITYNSNKNLALKLGKKLKTKEIYNLDVRKNSQIKSVFKKVFDKHKRIDVLVNNAGTNKTADFDKLKEKDWDLVVDTNLKGVFLCSQAVIKYMPKGGRVINIGSLSGEYGGPRTPSYAAAKAGVMSLTHCLARFLGKKKICVNCISPGVIGNDFTKKTMAPKVKKMVNSLLLIPRLGTFKDLLGAAVFLASKESSYITGQTLSVNGGAWVR